MVGEGGTGAEAMAEFTGVRSQARDPSTMSEKEVVPYFQNAKKQHLAIYAGVVDSIEEHAQTPLNGSGAGPYTGSGKEQHEWNEIAPGSLEIKDTGRGNAGEAHDTGVEDDKKASIEGDNVRSGDVDFKASSMSLTYTTGHAPKKPKDLSVTFQAHGVVLPGKMLIGDHAYAFMDVVEGNKLQFYNPWGSYQPKPITAKEFLTYFDSLATNAVPKQKTGGA